MGKCYTAATSLHYTMQVSIARVDASIPLPKYESGGAVGFDLVTREDTTIEPGAIGLIPGNVIIQVPKGYALLIVPRSSLPRKKSLVCPHSIGVIDQDYHGPDDEIFVQVQNISDEPVTVERCVHMAKVLGVEVCNAQWHKINDGGAEGRGGRGPLRDRRGRRGRRGVRGRGLRG